MLRKFIILMILILLILMTPGCKQQEVTYDLEKFKHINAYVLEIVPAIEEVQFDFEIWQADMTDPEKKEWLLLDADRIERINRLFLTEDFPPYEEVKTWVVPVAAGEQEWIIKGNKLAPALEKMEKSSNDIVTLIKSIGQSDDQIYLTSKRDELSAALKEAGEATAQLANLFIRES